MNTSHELRIWLDCHGGRTHYDLIDGHIIYTTHRAKYYGGDEYEAVPVPTQEQLERFCDELPVPMQVGFNYR